MALWVFRTCSPVDLTICLPGLTGPAVNIGVHGIMGIPYLFICRPVNLSSRVERSRGKYRNAGHYGYFVLFSSGRVNPEFGQVLFFVIMDILYFFTCRPVNLSPAFGRSRGQ